MRLSAFTDTFHGHWSHVKCKAVGETLDARNIAKTHEELSEVESSRPCSIVLDLDLDHLKKKVMSSPFCS
jgi:hypothetical protein